MIVGGRRAPRACSAASRSTGWTPNSPAGRSWGSATSAKTSSPRRHIARQALERGPVLVAACGERCRRRPTTSTATAPAGGHADEVGGRRLRLPEPTTASACRTQCRGIVTRAREHRHRHVIPTRRGDPTTTRSGNARRRRRTSGACSVSSSMTGQPTSSPARIDQLDEPGAGEQHRPRRRRDRTARPATTPRACPSARPDRSRAPR